MDMLHVYLHFLNTTFINYVLYKIVYEFVWNRKTDKVKRNISEQEYKGRYKMINLEDIITATSTIWIQKYLDNTERDWKKSFLDE